MRACLGAVSKAHARQGFTLIEVMFACGVVAVAFLLLLGAVVNISSLGQISGTRSAASSHISSVIEEISVLNYESLMAYQPPVLPGIGATESVEVAVSLNDGSTATLPVDPDNLDAAPTNPLQIRVTVLWQDKMGRTMRSSATVLKER